MRGGGDPGARFIFRVRLVSGIEKITMEGFSTAYKASCLRVFDTGTLEKGRAFVEGQVKEVFGEDRPRRESRDRGIYAAGPDLCMGDEKLRFSGILQEKSKRSGVTIADVDRMLR